MVEIILQIVLCIKTGKWCLGKLTRVLIQNVDKVVIKEGILEKDVFGEIFSAKFNIVLLIVQIKQS